MKMYLIHATMLAAITIFVPLCCTFEAIFQIKLFRISLLFWI